MSRDPLLLKARALWEGLAMAPVTFPPVERVTVVASPGSLMCPPGWFGVVELGGSVIVTAPGDEAADVFRGAVVGLPAAMLTDAATIGAALPGAELLGPAALGYLSADAFRPVSSGTSRIERVPTDHPDLRVLAQRAGADDAGESGLDEVTSPVFVVREGSEVVAAAGYRTWPAAVAHFSVLTSPSARGRGLARMTGSAAVGHALAAGLLPQWRARPAESRRVAEALGFRELGAQLGIKVDGRRDRRPD